MKVSGIKVTEVAMLIPPKFLEEMEEVTVRARNEKGHYMKDDPNTPENEAWTTKMVKKVKGTKKA